MRSNLGATRGWARRITALVSVALITAPEIAATHGGDKASTHVRATVGPLPEALAGMKVEVHRTLGTQLVLENRTDRTVEVLDESGVPFLRFEPSGVFANVSARSWFTTQGPSAVVPASATDGEPHWIRTRAEPSYGWFDPRVDTKVEVPHQVVDAGQPADIGRWEVTLRVNGEPIALKGAFRYEPEPVGAYRARLTSPAEIAPGVRVTLLPGQIPGLFLTNTSEEVVTVLGARGEPFLRIGPSGVEANLHSPTWWQSARSGERPPAGMRAASPPEWTRVAHVPRFGWIEPRATPARGRSQAAGNPGEQWEVPVRLGDRVLRLTGVTTWQPFTPEG